jgi:hypothetical protein
MQNHHKTQACDWKREGRASVKGRPGPRRREGDKADALVHPVDADLAHGGVGDALQVVLRAGGEGCTAHPADETAARHRNAAGARARRGASAHGRGAARRTVEEELLGDAAAEREAECIEQLLLVPQELLLRHVLRVALHGTAC